MNVRKSPIAVRRWPALGVLATLAACAYGVDDGPPPGYVFPTGGGATGGNGGAAGDSNPIAPPSADGSAKINGRDASTMRPVGDGSTEDGGRAFDGADAQFVDAPVVDAGPRGPIVDYKFDETSGAAVADSSGNRKNATAAGTYTWGAGKHGNAIRLGGTDGYVTLPQGVIADLTELTVAAWVQIEVAANWQRLFDFGNSTSVQTFLVPQNGESGVARFVMTRSGKAGQQLVNGPMALPTGVWKHVAVVVGEQAARLYIDGVSVAVTNGFTLQPSSMGSTSNNWIGRSQSTSDPYFRGLVDDFRIYDRALGAAEVASLAK